MHRRGAVLRLRALARGLVFGSVEREQLDAMIRATPWAWSLGVVGVVITYYQYGDGASASVARNWVMFISSIVLLRMILWAAWLALRRASSLGVGWAISILSTNLLFAGAWGLLSLLLSSSGQPSAEGILHVTLAAVAMGGTSRLAGFDRAMVAYVALVLTPLVARDLWIGGQFNAVMALLIPMVGMYALFSGLSTSKALRELERQRRRNVELVNRLREEVSRGELARKQLVEVGLARTRFFAAANHDLRQPLHALGLMAQAMLRLPASAKVQDLATRIQDCADGMADVVDELMELARADAENREPRWCALPLAQVVEECCRAFAAQMELKGLNLVVDVPDFGVRSDAAMLARIVSNLLSNALRYTHEGSVGVYAESAPPDAVKLRICDTGIGIAAEHLPRVFEAFYQAGNPNRDRGQGLGLGLSTVRRFTAQLGIEVELSSVPGEGTCVTLMLPACEPPYGQRTAQEPAESAPFAGRHVFAVEDDLASGDALRLLLETWGCDVQIAGNGESALRMASASSAVPDALIVDLRLPGSLNGLETVQALQRSWGNAIPTLIVSGDTGGALVEAVHQTGIPLLAKPVAPGRLRAFLAHAFSIVKAP